MDKHKLAACGIDCNECGQYKVTLYQDRESAEDLVEWFRSMEWIGENEGAETVLKRAPLCKGCWSDFVFCGNNSHDNKSHCFNSCCMEKKINNCGECVDFPCKKCIDFMTDGLEHHKKAMDYLTSINKTIFNK